MATHMRVFPDKTAADQAVQALIDAGVAGDHIHVLDVPAPHTGEERVGTFDDENAQKEREGTFDDKDARREREGSFDDTTGHRHNTREEPTGSFDTTDGPNHHPHHHHHSDRAEFEKALYATGVDHAEAARLLEGHGGGVAVVADSSESEASAVRQILG